MKLFLSCLLLLALLPLGATEKPNIILILADDLGWNGLRCSGSGEVDSRNPDRSGFDFAGNAKNRKGLPAADVSRWSQDARSAGRAE